MSGNSPVRMRKTRWHLWAGYVLAALGLAWVLRDVSFSELTYGLGNMDWSVIALAIAADTSSYLAQGWRWSLLLLPSGQISSWRATEAIYAGLFVNEIFPMRLGELLRGYVASQRIPASATAVASSILVERILDGIWMVLAVGIVALSITLPRNLVDSEIFLTVAMIVAIVLLAWAATRKSEQTTPERPDAASAPWLRRVAARLFDALGRTACSRSIFGAWIVSGIHLILQILSFWLVVVAYGIHLSIWQGAAVALIVRLGTMAPGAPSNIGTYQFFTAVGLTFFGVDRTVAAGFSLVSFVVLTFPLWLLGIPAFVHTGFSLRDLQAKLSGLVEKSPR